jgi:hypothetical protein
VPEQHLGQFLKRWQPLPPQLIGPPPQIVEHLSFLAVVPQLFETLLEQVGLKDEVVQLEQPVQHTSLSPRQVLPAAQQQPFLPLGYDGAPPTPLIGSRMVFPLRKSSARRTSSTASLACWRM